MKRILSTLLVIIVVTVPIICCASGFDAGDSFGGTEIKVEIDPADVPEGVSLEFYEAMETLKAYYDAYAECLKAVGQSEHGYEMLSEYGDLLLMESEYEEKMEAIDESKLTKQEDKLYVKTIAYILKKQEEALSYLD